MKHEWAKRVAERDGQIVALRSHEQRRHWLVVVVVAAMLVGAFSAQSLWPFLALHLFHGAEEDASARRPSLPAVSVHPPVAAIPPVDPALARLGTDDVGSDSPRMLHLVETHPGETNHEGLARIGTDPRNPQTYSVGSVMLNGARLIEVYADHVVLERSGEKVGLYLDSKGSQTSRAMPADLLLVGGDPPKALQNQPEVASGQTHNPMLADFVRSNPVFDGDRLRGVELFPGLRAGAFARLGLVEGDVITAVSGTAVTDASEVVNQLDQLLAGSTLEVTVKRGAQTIQVNLSGSVLSSESFSDTAVLGMGQESGQ